MRKTFNPCDDCDYSFGKQNQDSEMCHICEFRKYQNLEEQGLLLKLPCKVGDTVYYISEKIEKQGKKKVSVPTVEKGIVDNITFGSAMIPQITVCNNENIWTTFDDVEEFGKTVFLTQDEAEEALRKMKKKQ